MKDSDCIICKDICYDKKDGLIIPKDCYRRKFLKLAFKDLLKGSPPPKSVISMIMSSTYVPNSLIYYPYEQGDLKAAALILMRMGVYNFRVIHTHYLVEVFVDKSEEDGSLSAMQSPFFVLLHGFIPTPNRRLLDLIREFIEYKSLGGIDFMLFSKEKPSPELQSYFNSRELKTYNIRSAEEQRAILF